MSVFTAEVQGMDEIKRLFEDLNKELSAKQTRSIIDEAGRVIVKQARTEIPWNGMIGEFFKRDLGVYRDHSSSSGSSEYVLVGPRFKNYTIHGQDQKVAIIAQHMTEGFAQTDRETESKGRRGKVKMQTINPVLDAYRNTVSERAIALQKGVTKQLNKLKAKFPYIVKYVS